jgi:asparagine synthetase B (glutamine-hydrolysing)
MLFGWQANQSGESARAVVHCMAAALRVHARQVVEFWGDDSLAVGMFLPPPLANEETAPLAHVVSAGGRFALWMCGEVFDWDGLPIDGPRRKTVAQQLLTRLTTEGAAALRELDGEYQVVVFDRANRSLALHTDRFAALPIYWSSNRSGFAFAGGVRGVLMAPEVECRPDVTAIREAVSFGGYRLRQRTNVEDVAMAPPAAVLTVCGGEVRTRRYWSWAESPTATERPCHERLDRARDAWRHAMAARLEGSRKPGLLLSGGLDSRAILAEASVQRPGDIMAVSYGVPECDDVRYARRAARAAGAQWHLHPLYGAGWLERRLSHLHATDGLVNLVDLMHMEVLPQLADHMDVYLSGYIGDVVSGSTYFDIQTPDDLLAQLPYYGGTLGMPHAQARDVAGQLLQETAGSPRFAIYDHKFPQAINRVTEAARPWVRVRRPFVDYRFWRQAYEVPAALRRQHHWHEHWLRSTYPNLFARIPNQRTGVPPGASRFRHQVTRATRYGARRVLGAASRAGLPVRVPQRSYHPDWEAWRRPEVRGLISDTILRSDSIVGQVFGRPALADTLGDYFERDAAPTQVIGALFVFEHYHRTLSDSIRQWRAEGSRP